MDRFHRGLRLLTDALVRVCLGRFHERERVFTPHHSQDPTRLAAKLRIGVLQSSIRAGSAAAPVTPQGRLGRDVVFFQRSAIAGAARASPRLPRILITSQRTPKRLSVNLEMSVGTVSGVTHIAMTLATWMTKKPSSSSSNGFSAWRTASHWSSTTGIRPVRNGVLRSWASREFRSARAFFRGSGVEVETAFDGDPPSWALSAAFAIGFWEPVWFLALNSAISAAVAGVAVTLICLPFGSVSVSWKARP